MRGKQPQIAAPLLEARNEQGLLMIRPLLEQQQRGGNMALTLSRQPQGRHAEVPGTHHGGNAQGENEGKIAADPGRKRVNTRERTPDHAQFS